MASEVGFVQGLPKWPDAARDVPEEERHTVKRVGDPACGSGRMLLAVAEIQPHWHFVGQDVDLRCVRMCAINLALRNLSGYVIHGNSLTDERRHVYRTGFDLVGFISEVPLDACPEPVRRIAVVPSSSSTEATSRPPDSYEPFAEKRGEEPLIPGKQLFLF